MTSAIAVPTAGSSWAVSAPLSTTKWTRGASDGSWRAALRRPDGRPAKTITSTCANCTLGSLPADS